MQVLDVSEPSTYFSSNPVRIYDNKKNLFYSHANKEGSIKFNLPKGKFFSDFPVIYTRTFIPYPTIPIGELDYSIIPKDFLIKSFKNVNKATIFPMKDFFLSIIDPSISNHEFSPVYNFVLGHEMHHYFFHDHTPEAEKNCDKGAYNMLMRSGFNPAQAYAAQKILFDKNLDRTMCIGSAIDNHKIRR